MRLWEIAREVTRVLSESGNAPHALSGSLRVLSRELEWDLGQFWRVNSEEVHLECVEVFRPSVHVFPSFEQISKARKFAPGEGLPGLTWLERKAQWFAPLAGDPKRFPRLNVASEAGLQTGVATPLLCGKTVYGIFEFFSRELRPRNDEIRDFLEAVGEQIGLYLDRTRLEDALTGADAQFQVLARTTSDAIVTIDEQSVILYVNESAQRLFGYARDEMIGNKLTMLMPAELGRLHDAGLRRYIATGTRRINWEGILLPGLHKDGSTMQLEIAFGEFQREGHRYFSGYIRRAREVVKEAGG
jgi:PAS domain S-box-containing protein